MENKELIIDLFNTEYRKMVSVLCRLFGIEYIEMAEDIVNDTFLLAVETWGLKGIPTNPKAWLYLVAKNKYIDYSRRNNIYHKKVIKSLPNCQDNLDEIEINFSEENGIDSQLYMIFIICNPSISIESQVGLALRILCGFGITEIAEAFLTNKETINKRLLRAKEKLRNEKLKIDKLTPKIVEERNDAVLMTLYLLFNEGYYSITKNKTLSKDLCLEAMRLTLMLIENSFTNSSKANALMSLMCFHSSRFESRINERNEFILFEEQDKKLWDVQLIAKGNYFLFESTKNKEFSRFHIEASIGYWHSNTEESEEKWENILQLYNKLLQIYYSPIIALNRIFALCKANGKEVAIKEIEKLDHKESNYYYCLKAYLYTNIDNQKAKEYYQKSLQYIKTDQIKSFIVKRMNMLN